MGTNAFLHTKRMLIDHVNLTSSSLTAALMQKNYQFNEEHTSYASMQGLEVQTVTPAFTSAQDSGGRYHAFLGNLLFTNLTEEVGTVIIHANGSVGGVDRPVLFAIDFNKENLINSDFVVAWFVPVFSW